MPETTAIPVAETAAPVAPAPIPLVLPLATFTGTTFLKAVPLKFPVSFAGREWKSISLRRLSVAQIAAVLANHSENLAINPDTRLELPMFVDEAGVVIPDGLLDQLDADDSDDLSGAVSDFLPRRFKAPTDPSAQASTTGASTAASS